MPLQAQSTLADLPHLYRLFLPKLLWEHVPREVFATCSDCSMCLKEGQQPQEKERYFDPNVKCCTYFPTLPNYLVGALLSDGEPYWEEGRRRVREKIRTRIGVTPRGIAPLKKDSLLYGHSKTNGFGKSRSLLCPYYHQEAGGCTVWPFREAVCSTYFCKTATGKSGERFWTSVRDFLLQVEQSLVTYVLLQCDYDPEDVVSSSHDSEELSAEEADGLPPNEEDYKVLWDDQDGREEDFYCEAYQIVSRLTPEEFEKVGGINQQLHVDLIRKKRREMINPELPQTLKFDREIGPVQQDDGYFTFTKRGVIIRVSREVCDVLPLYDGNRSLEEVQRAVEIYKNTRLDEEVIINLYNHEILQAVTES